MIIIVVFIYSLCKIMKVANKNSIEIYRCYLFIHFVSITLLMLTWGFDFFYYVRQQSICRGNCDYPPIWEQVDNCGRIQWHHLMEWKAIFDMIPTEFSLDLGVLYLII